MNKTRIISFLILIGIFALAFSLRTIPFYSKVFIEGKVIFVDTDPYYHMRRIVYALDHSMKVLGFDPYLNYPEGQVSFWPHLFDRIISVSALLIGRGAPAKELTERVAAWFPPLMGSLTIFLVWLIGKELFSHKVGILSAFLFALQPGHLSYSTLGKVDQHVGETFFTLLFIYFFIMTLGRKNDSTGQKNYLWAFLTGFAIYLSYLNWSGTTLYLFPVISVMFLSLFFINKESLGRMLNLYILIPLVALLFLLYPCLTSWWGRRALLNQKALSYFQIYLFSFLILFFVGVRIFSGMLKKRIQSIPKIILSSSLLSVGLIFVFSRIFFPDFQRLFFKGVSWITKTENVWLTTIGENQPLLYFGENFSPLRAVFQLSWAFYLFPIALLLLFFTRRKEPVRVLFLLIWTISFCLITLAKLRFAYIFGANIALLTGYLFFKCYDYLKERRFSKIVEVRIVSERFLALRERLPKFLKGILTFKPQMIVILIGLIFLFSHSKMLYAGFRMSRPFLSRGEYETYIWIKENTPKTSSYNNVDLEIKPEYGIMAFWDLGHFIEYLSERPATVNPYGKGVDRMCDFFLAKNEKEANMVMEKSNCRFVISQDLLLLVEALRKISLRYPEEAYRLLEYDGPLVRIPKGEYLSLMGNCLHLHDGSQPIIPDLDIPGVSQYRLIYESPEYSDFTYFGGPGSTSRMKVFEYVKGARYRGRTNPLEEIEISLPLISNAGRRFLYRNVIKADEKGEFEVILPYATENSPYQTVSEEPYKLKVGEREISLKVTEEEVMNGRRVKA